jgi:hypothetical protein
VHGGAMVIELQRNAKNIIAFAFEQPGHDRRINTTRHGNDHASLFRRLVEIEAVHGHSLRFLD